MNADLTVVIPAYNRARSLHRALAAVARQTVSPKLVVVVDDGSTDTTKEVVSSWQTKFGDTSLQYIYQSHQGVSKARNTGLQAAETAFVAFLDSDDTWPADFVERTVQVLTTQPDAIAAITAQTWRINGRMPRQTLRRLIGRSVEALGLRPYLRQLWPDRIAQHTSFLPQNPVRWMVRYGAGISSCSVFQRNAIVELGGFDETLQTGEDSALYLPLSLRGRWIYVPGRPVLYGTAPERYGDEPHLSWSFTDNYRRWALNYEIIFSQYDFSQVFPVADQRRALRYLWEHADRELDEHGMTGEATVCRQKAAEYSRDESATIR